MAKSGIKLDVARMMFAAGILEIGFAIIIYLHPLEFTGPERLAPAISMLFLVGGITLLMMLRYGIATWRQSLLVVIPTVPWVMMGHYDTDPVSRVVLLTFGLAICTLPLFQTLDRHGAVTGDLFEIMYGGLATAVGLWWLVTPQAAPTVTFAMPYQRVFGLITLVGGVGMLCKLWPGLLPPRLLFLFRVTAIPFTLAVSALVAQSVTGLVMILVFGLALVFRPTLLNMDRLSRADESAEVRVERAAEAWAWLVVVAAVVMSFLEDVVQVRLLVPINYTVIFLVAYSVIAYWILPNLGSMAVRLRVHLYVLALTTAHLTLGQNPAARALAVAMLVPAMYAARALSLRAGYSVLASGLALQMLSGFGRIIVFGGSATQMTAVILQAMGVALAGGMVVRSVAEQRRLAEELQAAREDAQAANEELIAQNEELIRAGRALTSLAQCDSLTGLVNRRRFQELVEAELASGSSGALLFLDMDHFKEINDHFGHAAGDRVLQQVAHVLQAEACERDLVARLGGDEFAVLSPGSDMAAGRSLSDRILRQLRLLVTPHGPVSASLGFTLYPAQGSTVESLLIQADMAMYAVKKGGRDGVRAYDDAAGTCWETEVEHALAAGRLVLHFQPIMHVSTREVTRYEVLLRMISPTGEIIPPGSFLPHVEAMPLMHRVDRWVIRAALFSLQQFGHHGTGVELEVNLSGRAFDDPGLKETICSWLKETGVAPDKVIFEITETSAISDLNRAREFIQALRGHGCRFAIDDLGAGYSSLSYLKHLPVDYVKIDGSLIKDLKHGRDLALVQGIVALTRGLGLQTIAEWVEDMDTLELVRECGIDYAQGYLIGYPAQVLPIKAGTPL